MGGSGKWKDEKGMIYLLFGEIGVGKNYVGKRLADRIGFEFFDGDKVIPEKMAKKVSGFKCLSDEDLDEFVFDNLIPSISRKGNVVVAQALYMKRHREAIIKALNHQIVRQVWIPAPRWPTHMARLVSRKKGVRWAIYSLLSKPFFQEPDGNVLVINNGRNDDLDAQFNKFLRIVI